MLPAVVVLNYCSLAFGGDLVANKIGSCILLVLLDYANGAAPIQIEF